MLGRRLRGWVISMSMASGVGGFWERGLEDLDLSMSMGLVGVDLLGWERVDGVLLVSARAGRAGKAVEQSMVMSMSMASSAIGCWIYLLPTVDLAGAAARGAEEAALRLVREEERGRPSSGVKRRPCPFARSG